MRAVHYIEHIAICLYRMRVDHGIYLGDVAFLELEAKLRNELRAEASHIYYHTNLDLKRIRVNNKKVWRFVVRQ